MYKFSRIEEKKTSSLLKMGTCELAYFLYFEQRFVNCLARLSLQQFSFDKTRKTCMYLIV